MRTTIDIPDLAHQRLKALAHAKGASPGKLLIELSDQALGPASDSGTAVISSPVTGFLKLKAGRPVTAAELKASPVLRGVMASSLQPSTGGLS